MSLHRFFLNIRVSTPEGLNFDRWWEDFFNDKTYCDIATSMVNNQAMTKHEVNYVRSHIHPVLNDRCFWCKSELWIRNKRFILNFMADESLQPISISDVGTAPDDIVVAQLPVSY